MSSKIKETVIQFGEGGFLRSFADKFFDVMNKMGTYEGKVVVVQPIQTGLCNVLNEQKGKYNLFLRGISNGKEVCEHTLVESVSRAVNPYTDYQEFFDLADNPDFRVIVSNTTEAGIEYLGTENINDAPPKSFPAKLTVLLYRRYLKGLNGFIILSCELIDRNGDELKKCVEKYTDLWNLGEGFKAWLKDNNSFCSTLVDRICTGFPKEENEKEQLSKICPGDRLIDTAEIFHLWVIEGDFENELPFQKSGINVVWTDCVDGYKKRKVRILNGAHTSMVPAALLYGLKTVGECMKDVNIRRFLEKCIYDEILPTIGASDDNINFASSVFERFENPYIKHMLMSIALNSVSKFKVRVLPTMMEYREQNGKNPTALTFSLAALIAFYKKGTPNDLPEVTGFMQRSDIKKILSSEKTWGEDISVFLPEVEECYKLISESPKEEWFKWVK